MKPRLEQRHYVLIAEIISELPEPMREEVAKHFATKLHGTNDRYNSHRFREAAMGKTKKDV